MVLPDHAAGQELGELQAPSRSGWSACGRSGCRSSPAPPPPPRCDRRRAGSAGSRPAAPPARPSAPATGRGRPRGRPAWPARRPRRRFARYCEPALPSGASAAAAAPPRPRSPGRAPRRRRAAGREYRGSRRPAPSRGPTAPRPRQARRFGLAERCVDARLALRHLDADRRLAPDDAGLHLERLAPADQVLDLGRARMLGDRHPRRRPCPAGSPPCRAAGAPGCSDATAGRPPRSPRRGSAPDGASPARSPPRAAS